MLDVSRDWIMPPAAAQAEAAGPWLTVGAPWVQRPSPDEIARDAETAGWTRDNPHGLRKAAAKRPEVMASALVRMAEAAMESPDREVREAAFLMVQYFEDECWRWTTLEVFLNIRRAGGGLSRKAPVVARNAYIRELADMKPWAGMSPPAAADDMLARFRRYETTAWPREKHKAEPPRPQDRVRTLFWLIAKTGAPGPMPNKQDLCTHIEASRK